MSAQHKRCTDHIGWSAVVRLPGFFLLFFLIHALCFFSMLTSVRRSGGSSQTVRWPGPRYSKMLSAAKVKSHFFAYEERGGFDIGCQHRMSLTPSSWWQYSTRAYVPQGDSLNLPSSIKYTTRASTIFLSFIMV
jgi:hypothetical protein